jgi:hypothetical protein
MVETKRPINVNYPQYKESFISDRTKKGKFKKWLQKKLMAFMKKHKLLESVMNYEYIQEFQSMTLNTDDLWRDIVKMYDNYRYRHIEISHIIIGRDTYSKHLRGTPRDPFYLPYLSSDDRRAYFGSAEIVLHPDIDGVVMLPKRR